MRGELNGLYFVCLLILYNIINTDIIYSSLNIFNELDNIHMLLLIINIILTYKIISRISINISFNIRYN